MLWNRLTSSVILLSALSSIAPVAGMPQASSSTTSLASPTCCADCCDSEGNSLSPGITSSSSTATPAENSSPIITTTPAGGFSPNITATPANVSPSNAPTGLSNSTTTNNTSSSDGTSGSEFVVYSSDWVTSGLPDVSEVDGFTVVALSFILSTGPAAQAQNWMMLDATTRQNLLSTYHSKGIKVVVSAFGSTETPTTSGLDAATLANDFSSFVKQYDLDGIDVDYEDLAAMNKMDGSAETWLATFTKTLRSQLPQGQYILTHAPLAPWFSSSAFKGAAYLKVDKDVGNLIDWYNVQFYNQNDYTDCDSLLTKSSTTWAGSSLFEIVASGISQNKLLIGKPATAADATNGVIAPEILASCLSQAKAKGWSGGAMSWQYPHAIASWIKTVRLNSWPVSP